MNNKSLKHAVIITLIYFVISLIWIYFSDLAVASIAKNSETTTKLQTFKGLFYISFISIILFLLSYRFFRKEYLIYQRNMKEQKQNEQNILEAKQHVDRLAHQDILTQLPNRLSLIEYLNHRCSKNDPFGFLFLDLDGFKEINDSYGHAFGDQLLISIADILRKTLPSDSYLVRMGGDEFVIIIDCQNETKIITLFLDDFFAKLSHPIPIHQTDVYINGSIGIAMYPADATNYQDLLQKADSAMYHAKKSGHLNYSFYEKRFIEKAIKRTTLSTKLKKALNHNELTLYYQPQINVHTNQIEGVEALCRWFTPQGAIPPGEFIPIAEESGLILDIGRFALSQSSIMAKQWYEQGCMLGHVAVNVSARQLSHPDFLTILDEIVTTNQCSPHCIEIEITESSILENPEKMLQLLHSMKEKGYYLSMDDFGTGYSSLSYLKDLPIDKLKIDQSFVRNITHNPKNQIIVKTIINLGKGLGMQVLAEGVETQEELEFLITNGIDSVQGYYFHRPLSVDDLNAVLTLPK